MTKMQTDASYLSWPAVDAEINVDEQELLQKRVAQGSQPQLKITNKHWDKMSKYWRLLNKKIPAQAYNQFIPVRLAIKRLLVIIFDQLNSGS